MSPEDIEKSVYATGRPIVQDQTNRYFIDEIGFMWVNKQWEVAVRYHSRNPARYFYRLIYEFGDFTYHGNEVGCRPGGRCVENALEAGKDKVGHE